MSDQDNRPSADYIVEQYWPYDGPHSSESVESAAAVLAGLVRYMNNATWSVNPNGPSSYRLLSSLNSAVWGLDQLLEQLAIAASALADDPTMYDDRRDRPAAQTAAELANALAEARRAVAHGPRPVIERAAQLACHLGHETPRRGA